MCVSLHPDCYENGDKIGEESESLEFKFGSASKSTGSDSDSGAKPQKILRNVRAAVDDFVGDAEQFDDLTMLCMEYRGPSGE